ncbi:MAG: tetratricopeptide repeat protein [Bacteroidales bacterium]|nr:tetratricopeptide repeat protein [Bacteroidales bacterium]
MKAFKAYDIRGEWGTDLNEEIAYRIGYFLHRILDVDTVLVGRDMRLSSDTFFEQLTRGITDSGVNVDEIGLSTTPMVYWSTARYGYDASVMITASHNPKNHNGLKISRTNALPVGYDTGLNKLEAFVESDEACVPVAKKGVIRHKEVKDDYLEFQKQYVGDLSNLNIAVDCSSGMSSLFVHQLIGKAHYINDTLDGNFPSHEPNPLEAVSQEQIKALVKKEKCDIGLLFDGDADRITFIDELGNFISPDLMIAFLGNYFIGEKHEKGIVLQDIRSSRAIQEYLNRYQAKVETWRVGRAYAALKLRELDGVYGGELAGHYYFREFYYSDSALLAASIVLRLLAEFKRQGRTMSNIVKEISQYHNSGEINFKLERKQEAMDAVRDHFAGIEKPERYLDFDGYRLDYPDWWFNIRPSNTEPYLRFLAEAKDEHKLKDVVKKVSDIVKSFACLLLFCILFASCTNNPEKSRVALDKGIELMYRSSRFAEAEEQFTLAIKYDNNNSEAYYYRACTKFNQGRYNDAILDYQKALEIRPNYADAEFGLGRTYFVLNDFDMMCYYYRAAERDGRENMDDYVKGCPN